MIINRIFQPRQNSTILLGLLDTIQGIKEFRLVFINLTLLQNFTCILRIMFIIRQRILNYFIFYC